MKPKLGLQEGSAAQLVSARAAGLQSPVHSRKKKSSGVWSRMRDSLLRFLFKFYKAHQTLPESYTYILLLLNLLQASFPNSGVCRILVVHPDNQVWIFDTVVVLTAFFGGIGAWVSQIRIEKDRKRTVADNQVDMAMGQAEYSSWIMLLLAYLAQFVVINIAARGVSTCLLSLTMPTHYQNNSRWTIAGLAPVYLDTGLRAFQLFLQVLTGLVSLMAITLYVVFIENPIPRMSLLSASNGLNSLLVVLTPGLCILFGVIGKVSLYGMQISLQSNSSDATFLILLIARSIPSLLAIINILTRVVFYNKQAGLTFGIYHLLVYFLSIFDFLHIVLGAHQDILKVYSLLASFLFVLCVALIRNLLEAKRLSSFKSDDFEIVNRVVQECFPGNPAYGTQNQELNVTMYMNYVAPGISSIVKSFLEQELRDSRTFRSPPEILLMSLFDELLKCKIDNGFTACVVYIYYLTNINFSLSRVLLLHSLLRMSVAGISQQFLLLIVEEMISSRIDHCMRRGDMIIHERLAISQCAKDSSGLKKTNKNVGFRDEALGQMSGSVWMFPQQNNGESNSSLRFQRRNKDNLSGVFQTEKSRLSMKGLHMYQTYELMLEAVQTQLSKVLEFYETLSAPDMNIYQLHQNSEAMCMNSAPPKLLFASLEQECLGECSFHLIPYGLYIHLAENNSQVMRENLRKYATRSKSLLKRVTSKLWHWQCKASEVILETSLEPMKRGEILYTSRIPRWFCRHPHAKEYVLRQNISALFPEDLARHHSLLVNQYLERFDREYFGKEIDRYIRGFGAENFMRVAVNTTISTSLSRGVSAITLIVPSRQEDYFLVFQDGKALIGISESLARLDPAIVDNVRKRELTEISAELPAYLEQLLQSQYQKSPDSPPKQQSPVEDVTDSPTARDNPRDKDGDTPVSGVKDDHKDYGLLVKKPPVDPEQKEPTSLHFSFLPNWSIQARDLRIRIDSFAPRGQSPILMLLLYFPKSQMQELSKTKRASHLPQSGVFSDIDEDEHDGVDSFEDIGGNSPDSPGGESNLGVRSRLNSYTGNELRVQVLHAQTNIGLPSEIQVLGSFKAGTASGPIVGEQTPSHHSSVQDENIGQAGLAKMKSRVLKTGESGKWRQKEGQSVRMKQTTENLKVKMLVQSGKQQAAKEGQEEVLSISLGPSLASSLLRRVGQSGLTVDKISTNSNIRFFVALFAATLLLLQSALWVFYYLNFIYLSGLTDLYNQARTFVWINLFPVLSLYQLYALQAQMHLTNVRLLNASRYTDVGLSLARFDIQSYFTESTFVFYNAYNTHKNFTAPVDNRFIPALLRYKYEEPILLGPKGERTFQNGFDNYKWQLAALQNLQIVQGVLAHNQSSPEFIGQTHMLLHTASKNVALDTNTEIIVKQGEGYASIRTQVFWSGLGVLFFFLLVCVALWVVIRQFRQKIIWIYRAYRGIDMQSVLKKQEQLSRLRESIATGGRDQACLSNTFFLKLLLKIPETHDGASTVRKSSGRLFGKKVFSLLGGHLSNVEGPNFEMVPQGAGSNRTIQKANEEGGFELPARQKISVIPIEQNYQAGVLAKRTGNWMGTEEQTGTQEREKRRRVAKSRNANKSSHRMQFSSKRIKALTTLQWFGVGYALLSVFAILLATIATVMVVLFSKDEAKDRITQIYADSSPMTSTYFYTYRALLAMYGIVLTNAGEISASYKQRFWTVLRDAQSDLEEIVPQVTSITSGRSGADELQTFGDVQFLQNSCRCDYLNSSISYLYQDSDCHKMWNGAFTQGYASQFRWLVSRLPSIISTLQTDSSAIGGFDLLKSQSFTELEFYCNIMGLRQFEFMQDTFFLHIADLYDNYFRPGYLTYTVLMSVASCALLVFSSLLILRMNKTMKACLYSLLPLPSEALLENGSIKPVIKAVGALLR